MLLRPVTRLLILLGNGVVAGVLLNKSKAQGAGWGVITTAWGLAVGAKVQAHIAASDVILAVD